VKRSAIMLLGLGVVLIVFAGCSADITGGAEVTINARVIADEADRASRVASEVSVNITPSSYRIALTYFALVDSEGSEVAIVELDEPEIFDFSTAYGSGLLLGKRTIPKGTYVGYKMRFTYLEMVAPVAFDVPTWSTDSSHPYVTGSLVESVRTFEDHTFRCYYNTDGNYWKRDVLLLQEGDTPDDNTWVWMRREVEDSEGNRNFFIDQTSHPSFGVVDLFDNSTFWGDSDDYDDETVLVTVASAALAGGTEDASMDPFSFTRDETLVLNIDIIDTFNFWEVTGSDYENGKLDLGPSYDEIPIGEGTVELYGDKGFHPFMPEFTLTPIS